MERLNQFANEMAYKCLTNEEKQSLILSVGYGRTSWEVGGMMNVTHYKYLELKERAEKFFKLFYDYFSLHESLIRPRSGLDERFMYFVEACLEHRVKRKESKFIYGDSSMVVTPIKKKLIVSEMNKLRESENDHDIDLYKLIMEFDRWNSWRILPRELQQPSAYKRRNNRRDIFYIKYVCSLPEEKVKVLQKKFASFNGGKRCYFCAFHKDLFNEGYKVLTARILEETIEKLSKLYIYVFDNREDADSYGFLVTRFQYENKSPTKGQSFWPEYRGLISKTMNYERVNNIEFYCDNLDKAYGIAKKTSKKSQKALKKRTKDKDFYL